MKSSDEINAHDPLAIPLAQLRRGESAVVSSLEPGAGLAGEHAAAVAGRLRDLGFVAGARCEVIARMWPAGDPLVVRVGGSTFALRRIEADVVRVTRLATEPATSKAFADKRSAATA